MNSFEYEPHYDKTPITYHHFQLVWTGRVKRNIQLNSWGVLMNIQEFKEMWVGRTFQCRDTGATFTIPEDVLPKDFYSIGEGYIDVGDGRYSRGGGNIVEISTEEIL